MLLLPVLYSCVTSEKILSGQLKVMEALKKSDYPQAQQEMEAAADDYRDEDKVLLSLDRGMVLHYAGENKSSNLELQQADFLDEELYGQKTGQQVAAALTNDNALDYQAEDFESIYLNIFGALNYVRLGISEDARVEVRRLQEKLVLLEDKYQADLSSFSSANDWGAEALGDADEKLPFHNSAMSRYLSMVLERATAAPDDFRLSGDELKAAFALQPELYPFAVPPLPVYQAPQEGLVAVNALVFSGSGPIKYAEKLALLRVPGGLAVNYEGKENDATSFVIPMPDSLRSSEFRFYKFELPRLRERASKVDRVVLEIDGGRWRSELSMLEDISRVAVASYESKWPLILARTVVRVVIKVVANEVASQALQLAAEKTGSTGLSIAGKLTGAIGSVVVTASEGADLRGSGFFPARSFASELWIEPGEYPVSLAYYSGDTLLKRKDMGLRKFSGKLNLIEDFRFE